MWVGLCGFEFYVVVEVVFGVGCEVDGVGVVGMVEGVG